MLVAFSEPQLMALGSALDATAMSIVYVNTNLGAAAGVMAAMALTQAIYKKIDLTLALNGAIGGLVAITAGPDLQNHLLSIIIGGIILFTASFFVTIDIAHPLIMLLFLILISVSFSLFGFILGVWADGWEKLTIVPILVIMPLTFLGGTFYSISMLPPAWQTISLFNPVVYLISGFRWAFYENADVAILLSLGMVVGFLTSCLVGVWWIFKTGYKLRT